jgi:hypothetical protein
VSKVFTEQNLSFAFSDNWEVEQYDRHGDYLGKIQKLRGSKAVDFVGMISNALFLIEVKDFRGHRIENKNRFGGPLEEEVALKVRDTVAGLIGAHRTSSQPATWSHFVSCMSTPSRLVRVVLWFEDDAAHTSELARARAITATDLLKKNLRWLTTQALAVGLKTHAGSPPELRVLNLPGAGSTPAGSDPVG